MTEATSEYRRLPYTRRVEKHVEEDGPSFIAYVEEIPWIRVHADSDLEARHLLDQAFDECIEAMLEAGDEVPRPARWPHSAGVPATVSESAGVRFEEIDDLQPWEDVQPSGNELQMA